MKLNKPLDAVVEMVSPNQRLGLTDAGVFAASVLGGADPHSETVTLAAAADAQRHLDR